MRTPRIGLAHELQHSFDVDKKVATYERTKNGILLMDIRAINTENRIRKVIGEPKRTMYGTQKVPKELLEYDADFNSNYYRRDIFIFIHKV